MNMITSQIAPAEKINTEGLQLNPIVIDPEYCEEWHINMEDYMCLTMNGNLLRPTLYRVGGIGRFNITEEKYFMLLKYEEAYWDKDILKTAKNKDPKHLSSRWCILNHLGEEKQVFNQFKSPYLIKNSCIYTLDSGYYNIETGELICRSYTTIESEKHLILDNRYDNDTTKKGVMKINKLTGIKEFID